MFIGMLIFYIYIYIGTQMTEKYVTYSNVLGRYL